MLQKFIENIEAKKLFTKIDKILVTVSGGADSVVLLDLLFKAGYNFAIAHCNFKIRIPDADIDEVFVKDLASKYNVEFFSKVLPAVEYAEKNKISVEMAARELRYQWFNEVAENHSFTKIATGHHSDDNIETILLNITRKTGIKGIAGIPEVTQNIVRPLLFASKQNILDYCKINKLDFRTDYTNNQTEYQRNKIRHNIIPEFQKINPAFNNNLLETTNNIKKYYDFFLSYFSDFQQNCISFSDSFISINIDKLKSYNFKVLFLFEFLKDYGFNYSQINNITNSLDSISGKIFYTEKYRITKERNDLILSEINKFSEKTYLIYEDTEILYFDIYEKKNANLLLKKEKIEDISIINNRNYAYFDFDKLKFPLLLRKWQKGDFFKPFGMNGKIKKLSDFFIDKKFSKIQKENTWILESDSQIIWVVGHRTDEMFKVSQKTKSVFKIFLQYL